MFLTIVKFSDESQNWVITLQYHFQGKSVANQPYKSNYQINKKWLISFLFFFLDNCCWMKILFDDNEENKALKTRVLFA